MSNALKLVSVLTLTALASCFAVGCADESADDEDQGATEGELKSSGSVLTSAQVAGHLRNAGFAADMVGKMTCVAKYESSFNERATNGSHFGLWQIATMHVGKVNGCPDTKDELFDGAKNAKCALGVFKAQGIGAWTAYKSHKSECDSFVAPASAPSTGSGGSSGSISKPSANDDDEGFTPTASATTTTTPTGGANDCWSNTLGSAVAAGSCVESARSQIWFQCNRGRWVRASSTSGPVGKCTESFPLQQ